MIDAAEHPDASRLSAFASGLLDDAESAAIETHLQSCDECCTDLKDADDFPDPLLSRLRMVAANETLGLPATAPARVELGPPTVPGYEILGELGRGGMGVVYKARQTRLNRLVALKMLLSGAYAGPESLLRFRAEAEAIARLRHANIVQIFEIGDLGGLPYLALEYLPGGSLAEIAGGPPIAPRDAAALVESLARGIAAAHGAGVIHRDLKPANVLLTAERVPKVTDFGLAKMADDDRGLTHTGTIAGTPAYMAPEQATGQKVVAVTIDIYGLGTILYELLTGRPPFRGGTSLETIKLVCTVPPVSPRRIRPEVPRDLETICLKCLHKEPHRRYASAEALADDLARFQEGRPVSARPVGYFEAGWRAARRRPELAALFGFILLIAAVGFPLVTALWLDAAKARGVAQSREAEANSERNLSRRQLADLYLDRGLDLAEHGEVNVGLHWMLEALNTSPSGDVDFQRVARLNLADWSRQAVRPMYFHALPEVRSVAFSPDGRTYALGDFYAKVRFFETETGQQTGPTIDTGEKNVSTIAFSPDGTRIIAGCNYHFNFKEGPKAARIFDVATGDLVAKPLMHQGLVGTVAWSPDGRRVATGGKDGAVRIWNAATGEPVVSPITFKGSVISRIAFAENATRLIIYAHEKGNRRTIRLWDIARNAAAAPPLEFDSGDQSVSLFEVSSNAESAIVPAPEGGGSLRHYDAATGKLHGEIARFLKVLMPTFSSDGMNFAAVTAGSRLMAGQFGPGGFRGSGAWHPCDDEAMAAAFSPDGRTVLTHRGLWRIPESLCGPAGRPADVQNGPRLPPVPNYRHAAFSPDARRVIFGHGALGQILPGMMCDTATGAPLAKPPMPVGISAFSPEGRYAALCKNGWNNGDFAVRIWDTLDGGLRGAAMPDGNNVQNLAFTADGSTLVTGGLYGVARRWEAATGKPIEPGLSAGGFLVDDGFAISPDGKLLATGSYLVNKGRVWDMATGQPLGPFVPGVLKLRYDSPGQSLLVWTAAAARIWNATMTEPRTPPFGQGTVITHAAFSPDGKRVITAGRDGLARLWSAATGEPASREMHGPEEPACIAFSPDGKRIAIGHADGTVRLWDAATGWPAGAPLMQPQAILAIAWAADGQSLFTASAAGSVRCWPMPMTTDESPEQLASHLERLTGMRMTGGKVVAPILPEEWSRLSAPSMSERPSDLAEDYRARDAEDAGDASAALWHLDRLARSRPGDWLVQARRGHALLLNGDMNGAEAAYRAAASGGASLEWWFQAKADAMAIAKGDELSEWYKARLRTPIPPAR